MNEMPAYMVEWLEEHAFEALTVLASICANGPRDADRLRAAQELLNRAYGPCTAAQKVSVDFGDATTEELLEKLPDALAALRQESLQ